MTVYRRPILSNYIIWTFIPCIPIILLGLWAIGNNKLQLLLFGTFIVVSILLVSLCACYVITTSDKLIFRNVIYFWWRKEFIYEKIIKIRFVFIGGRYNSYIQVVTAKGKSKRILIELVDKKDYNSIIADLKKHGVRVETKGLEAILKRYS